MRTTLLLLIFAAVALAQDKSALRIVVTMPDGTKHESAITGPPAAAGLQILQQSIAAEQACDLDGDGNNVNCRAKFANPALYVRALVIEKAKELALLYPSSQLKPLVDDLKAREAAIAAARKALFDAAKAQ